MLSGSASGPAVVGMALSRRGMVWSRLASAFVPVGAGVGLCRVGTLGSPIRTNLGPHLTPRVNPTIHEALDKAVVRRDWACPSPGERADHLEVGAYGWGRLGRPRPPALPSYLGRAAQGPHPRIPTAPAPTATIHPFPSKCLPLKASLPPPRVHRPRSPVPFPDTHPHIPG